MIRNETEYRQAIERIAEEAQRIAAERAKLRELGYARDQVKRAIDPMQSFHEQLKEEVASYERLMRGEFDELRNFDGVGRLLIALRIAQGVSQRELAERLGVHESQVSRDERNEYHGITVERANRVLNALGVELRSVVEALEKVPA